MNEPLKLVQVEVLKDRQLVMVTISASPNHVALTLRESEALIADLYVANAQVRGLIAKHGDVAHS